MRSLNEKNSLFGFKTISANNWQTLDEATAVWSGRKCN